MNKSEHEIEVFSSFAKVARLGVEPGTVRSEDPPLPDISCNISGELRYFELTRAVDQKIADDMGYVFAQGRKTGEAPPGKVNSYCDKEIITGAITRKAAKSYDIGDTRLDLLVYCDGVLHGRLNEPLIEDTVVELRERYRERWGSIWIYSHHNRILLVQESSRGT